MSELIAAARCPTCGQEVGLEDGMRTDACECDPVCAVCEKRFQVKSARWAFFTITNVCPDCVDLAEEGFEKRHPFTWDSIRRNVSLRDTLRSELACLLQKGAEI